MKITPDNIDEIRYLLSGDRGLFVSFAAFADSDAILLSRHLAHRIREAGLRGVLDTTPGMNNVLVTYDGLEISSKSLQKRLHALVLGLAVSSSVRQKHWVVPVCYGGVYGPDLEDVAEKTNLASDEVILRHCAKPLTIAIMGFLPGLAYMKGVDEGLYLPRRSRPRQHVPALSVGIAMDQTVIYPLQSPGGWNLLGRTPIRVFDASRSDPVLLRPGDRVSFRAIDGAEFKALDRAVQAGEDVVSSCLVCRGAGR